MFHPVLKQMHQEFGDRIFITFRNYPLVPPHNNAVPAASAAEAAGMQGKNKFWEMHALIYESQDDWKNLPDVRPLFEDICANRSVSTSSVSNVTWPVNRSRNESFSMASVAVRWASEERRPYFSTVANFRLNK